MELDADFTRLHPSLKPGSYVRLAVSDTGPGIPDHLINRILDPFFTTKKVGEGTGLGLSVVHGIVKNHGGEITVESQPSIGTTVTVFLPAIDEESQSEENEIQTETKYGSGRILVVDDEKLICHMVSEMLTNLGYTVTSCLSSLEAIEVFQQNPQGFDLAITDLTMPEMLGTQLAAKLIAIRPDLPVILCTGYGQVIEDSALKKYGIRSLIRKPILTGELSQVVRRELDSSGIPEHMTSI